MLIHLFGMRVKWSNIEAIKKAIKQNRKEQVSRQQWLTGIQYRSQ